MSDDGLDDAAILLMSLGEEQAAEVFKYLSPKEVQKIGERMAKLQSIPRDRVDQVLTSFSEQAMSQSSLVADTDDYVRAVLTKEIGRAHV